jgi:hypothetical protein
MKNGSVKVIATEESLDNWHAQSLGISVDKLNKARRYIH